MKYCFVITVNFSDGYVEEKELSRLKEKGGPRRCNTERCQHGTYVIVAEDHAEVEEAFRSYWIREFEAERGRLSDLQKSNCWAIVEIGKLPFPLADSEESRIIFAQDRKKIFVGCSPNPF